MIHATAGRLVSYFIVVRWLHIHRLFVRWPVLCVLLTPVLRRLLLPRCRKNNSWIDHRVNSVDKSLFSITSIFRISRQSRQHIISAPTSSEFSFRSNIMISISIFQESSVTGIRYCTAIRFLCVRLFRGAMNNQVCRRALSEWGYLTLRLAWKVHALSGDSWQLIPSLSNDSAAAMDVIRSMESNKSRIP